MGEAYLAFARQEPGLYSAMFDSARLLSEAPLAGSSAAAMESLKGAARATLAHFDAHGCDGRMLAAQIWAASHGFASLA